MAEKKPTYIDFENGEVKEFEETDNIPVANLPSEGASGTFTAQSGETITVVNGIITAIDPP